METIKESGFDVVTKTRITEEEISAVVVTAMEGGSNYWYFVDTKESKGLPPKKNDGSISDCLTMRISKALAEDPNFSMPVRDIENREDVLGVLSQESMKKAFEIAAKEYPRAFQNIMTDNGDAEDADIIFQLAVMGELVFG